MADFADMKIPAIQDAARASEAVSATPVPDTPATGSGGDRGADLTGAEAALLEGLPDNGDVAFAPNTNWRAQAGFSVGSRLPA